MNQLFPPKENPSGQAKVATPLENCAIIAKDTVVKGEISKCECLKVSGYIDGTVNAGHVELENDGKIYGTLNASSAEIHGTFQGDITVSGLLNIGPSGSVTGKVLYGQIAMAQGAILSAEVRNIPPTLSGDLDLTVPKGGSIAITTTDLTAIDPDDKDSDLTFSASKVIGGHIAQNAAPTKAITTFTQSDILARKILFVHNGILTGKASFDVLVTDGSGAKSGSPQTVTIHIK